MSEAIMNPRIRQALDEAHRNTVNRHYEGNRRLRDEYDETMECKPMGNDDRNYFDKMHNAMPVEKQIAEDDRINLERLKKSDSELFSYAHSYLFDDWDKLKPLIILVLAGADDTEVGRLLRELKDGSINDYLTMVRK
jgi:hypothetical protein